MFSYLTLMHYSQVRKIPARLNICIANRVGKEVTSFTYHYTGNGVGHTIYTHWTDFHEVLYLRIFRKSFEKIQV